ncbi:unnamed protein product [Brassica rapa]|uniref:DUF4005 domain-containing protein n=1 Tax=Brassica campestris TaxID=3711 RepID=A0A3P5YY55_BRACM|nr:unnamed protein product [Brassica rapa]VDC65681.1 unnamed protein product [Brassica rapa]
MGKTPGKWIKTLLLGKKSSPKSNLVVSAVKDDFSNLSLDPPVASSQPDAAASTAQHVVAPSNGDDLESMNELDELKLGQAASKIQAVFRARQARRAIRTLKGIIRLQAVIRGHLVRRQAVATYSCIWGIVKLQALVRGRIARSSSDSVIQCHKPPLTEVNDSEALQVSMCSWMNNPSKFIIVNKLLASSPAALPLKIQYGAEEPNSANVWLERWTQLHVWSPPPRAAKILVPQTKTKKRNYQAVVDSEKARPKQVVKKQSGSISGKVSNRSSTTESEKPKRSTVRKASALSKDPLRTESDKAKQKSRKSRSASKEEVKEEKPRPSLKRTSLSNTSLKVTRKSAEKKKDPVDSVQIEPEVKVSDNVEVGDDVESAEKEKGTADSVQIEPGEKVSDVLEGGGDAIESSVKEIETVESVQIEPEVKVSDVLGERDAVELAEKGKDTADSVQIEPEVMVSDVLEGGEKEKDTTDEVPKELDVEEEEKSPEEDELRTSETNDKGEEDLKCSDVKVSSENGNIASDNSKPSERRVSHANDEGRTHSGRKIPSYMAPTASTLRRHSLPSPANGKPGVTTTISPRAHKLLLASAKGSMNGDKSASSLKNKSDKSNKTEWKR